MADAQLYDAFIGRLPSLDGKAVELTLVDATYVFAATDTDIDAITGELAVTRHPGTAVWDDDAKTIDLDADDKPITFDADGQAGNAIVAVCAEPGDPDEGKPYSYIPLGSFTGRDGMEVALLNGHASASSGFDVRTRLSAVEGRTLAGVAVDVTRDYPAFQVATALAPFLDTSAVPALATGAGLDLLRQNAAGTGLEFTSLESLVGSLAGRRIFPIGGIGGDADFAVGTFTTVDIIDAAGNVIYDDLDRAYAVGSVAAIWDGDDAGSIYEITASGACTLVAECLGGDLLVLPADAASNTDIILMATNTAGGGGTTAVGQAATGFTWINQPEVSTADRDLLDLFVRPTVIFSRCHVGYGSENLIDPTTKVPNAGFVSGSDLIVDGAVYAGGTILLVGQADPTLNGPWDPDPVNPATAAMTRPANLNGWVTADMVSEGMPFWVGSGLEFGVTKWSPSWSAAIYPDGSTDSKIDTLTVHALEGFAPDASDGTGGADDGDLLQRDSTASRGYSPIAVGDLDITSLTAGTSFTSTTLAELITELDGILNP